MHRAHAHVAHEEERQAVERALLLPDGVEVGEHLGGMLAPAVTAVDDGHGRPLGGLCRRTLLVVPDGDDVAVVLQHVEGVLEGLHVEVAGAGHLGVGEAQHVAAQAMHGRLRGEARARAGLVEGRQQRLVGQQVRVAPVPCDGQQVVGDLEDAEVLVARHVPQRQDVAALEASHGVSSPPPGRGPGAPAAALPAPDERRTPLKITATVSSGPTRPSRVSVMRPARPAVPVWSASMPRSGRARRLAASMVGLVHDHAATAGQQHGPHDGQPVVGLVVEDAMGEAVRLGLPGPHVGRAVGRDLAQPGLHDIGGDGLAGCHAEPIKHEGMGPSQREAALRLDRIEAWPAVDEPDRPGVLEGQRLGRGEGPATHVDDEAIEGGGVVRQLVDELPAERGAALDGVAVEVALDGEGHGAGSDGCQQAVVGGVAGLSGLALADLDAPPPGCAGAPGPALPRWAARRRAAVARRRAPRRLRPARRCRSWRWPVGRPGPPGPGPPPPAGRA